MVSKKELTRLEIQAMHKAGTSEKEIAKLLKLDIRTVRLWANRDDVSDQPRNGRPSKLSQKTARSIRDMGRNQVGVGTRKIDKRLNNSVSYQTRSKIISRSTLLRHIKRQPWARSYTMKVKPLLSIKNIGLIQFRLLPAICYVD